MTNDECRNTRLPLFPHWTAFTLVELLVVVAIIALLISLLLPALRAAKMAAQDLVCQTNQRQVGIAAFAYAGDYNGILPSRGGDPNNPPSYTFWWISTTDAQAKLFETVGPKTWACVAARSRITLPNMSAYWYADYQLNPQLGGYRRYPAGSQPVGWLPKQSMLNSKVFWWGDGPVWSNLSNISFIRMEFYPENVFPNPLTTNAPWMWNKDNALAPGTGGQGHGNGMTAYFVYGDLHVDGLTRDRFLNYGTDEINYFVGFLH